MGTTKIHDYHDLFGSKYLQYTSIFCLWAWICLGHFSAVFLELLTWGPHLACGASKKLFLEMLFFMFQQVPRVVLVYKRREKHPFPQLKASHFSLKKNESIHLPPTCINVTHLLLLHPFNILLNCQTHWIWFGFPVSFLFASLNTIFSPKSFSRAITHDCWQKIMEQELSTFLPIIRGI